MGMGLRITRLASALTVAALGLAGCFDLSQSVSIDREGSGHFTATAAAKGFVGDALKNADLVDPDRNHVTANTAFVHDEVMRTATVDSKSLSELALPNEVMTLAVTGHDFFGLGPSHVAYRARLFVDRAKAAETPTVGPIGEALARGMLGGHIYVFTVTVPGSIEHIAPIALGGETFEPQVSGDFYHGQTITWRLPLYKLVEVRALDFEVDFSAYGFFSNAKTQTVASE